MARRAGAPAGGVIQLPANGWRPREYQKAAWSALEAGVRRFSLCWHRRAGKDEFALHAAAVLMHERPGVYWHMLPQANQARKAIWDAVDENTGVRRIDQAFPLALRDVTREHEMFIRFRNGATWQAVGSDNYNSLVGSPPVGLIGSEWALADPRSWDFLRPILANNNGVAMFITTPRGQNHYAKMHQFALRDEAWFAQTLGVADTGAIGKEVLDREFRELAAIKGDEEAKAIFAQEYECSFDAALPGAYFGALIGKKEQREEIGLHPWDPRYPVGWGSDLGRRDSTTFWFWQDIGGKVRLIDFFEASGVDDVAYYANRLRSLPYAYARGLLPHDGGHNRLGMAGSIAEQFRKLGVRCDVVPVTKDLVQAIAHTRVFLTGALVNVKPVIHVGYEDGQAAADARMRRALDGIRMYRREWNEAAQRYDDRPLHDWCSNIADGLRTVACGYRPLREPVSGALGAASGGGRTRFARTDG